MKRFLENILTTPYVPDPPHPVIHGKVTPYTNCTEDAELSFVKDNFKMVEPMNVRIAPEIVVNVAQSDRLCPTCEELSKAKTVRKRSNIPKSDISETGDPPSYSATMLSGQSSASPGPPVSTGASKSSDAKLKSHEGEHEKQ